MPSTVEQHNGKNWIPFDYILSHLVFSCIVFWRCFRSVCQTHFCFILRSATNFRIERSVWLRSRRPPQFRIGCVFVCARFVLWSIWLCVVDTSVNSVIRVAEYPATIVFDSLAAPQPMHSNVCGTLKTVKINTAARFFFSPFSENESKQCLCCTHSIRRESEK